MAKRVGPGKDMTSANWARTLKRLRRLAEELRRHDFRVTEPPSAELPPSKRYAQGGPVTGVAVILGERGPKVLVDRNGHRL